MIIILFGLPGAGKTYLGKLMHKQCNYFFYDGDHDLTDAIRDAIATRTHFTDDMREEFFNKLLQSIKRLSQKHVNLVVAQTFIKERYRLQVLREFPDAQFVLVQASRKVRENRLIERAEMPLEPDYVLHMERNFESPKIVHTTIQNNGDNDDELLEQLKKIV